MSDQPKKQNSDSVYRLASIVKMLLTVVIAVVIERRVVHEHRILHVLWIVLCVMLVALQIQFLQRFSMQMELMRRVYAQFPRRYVLFMINALLTIVILVSVFEYWGLLMCAMLGVGVASLVTRRPRSNGSSGFASLVRNSPPSFVMIYLALLGGEIYLRMNPELIFRGGGFNPAVRTQQANLYELNSLNLRNGEITETPSEGVFRILAVGDSFTFGQGVTEDGTYPRILEMLLNEGGGRFEVINAGNRGASTADELDFLRHVGLGLHPDLVTVQFYLNDVFPPRPPRTIVDNVMEKLTLPSRRSYVLFLMNDLFRSVRYAGDIKMAAARIVENKQTGWQRCALAIEVLGATCREANVPIVMLLYPGVSGSDEAERIIHAAVARECAKHEIPVIDLLGVFDDVPSEKRYAHPADHHPSALVHEVVARHIAMQLKQLKLLPTSIGSD